LYRRINDFKKGYQPITDTVKDEMCDLVTDPHNNLAKWSCHFSQLLNTYGVNYVTQTEINRAEPLVLELTAFEFEMAIEKVKSHKFSGFDEIPADLITAGGRTIRSDIHKLNCIWNNEELPEERKDSIIVPIYKKGDKADCRNCRGISLLSTAFKILSTILLSNLIPYAEEITLDHQCGFRCNSSTINYIFCICHILGKKWEYNEAVYQLFINFKKAYDRIRRDVLYNTVIEFGIAMNLVRLIKMHMNETYSRVHVGKHLSDIFPIKNDLKL